LEGGNGAEGEAERKRTRQAVREEVVEMESAVKREAEQQ